jgi:excisionase family DNA binding protein
MRRRRRALTTGQAADLCLVTSDTIVNWIKSGLIAAQRTAGGQYRIRVDHLRAFMTAQGMDTEALDEAPPVRRLCWQFHEARGSLGEDEALLCRSCIVRFLGAYDCFKLMGMHPGEGHPHPDCEECEYYRRWGDGYRTGDPDVTGPGESEAR